MSDSLAINNASYAQMMFNNTNWNNPMVGSGLYSNPYNFNFNFGSSSSSSSSLSTSSPKSKTGKKTFEEAKKEREEEIKLSNDTEYRTLKQQCDTAVNNIDTLIKTQETQKKDLENNKKSDGTSKITVPKEQRPSGVMRWVANGGKCLESMWNGFIGKDETGKNNYGKAALNIGLAVGLGVLTCIPPFGTALGVGLACYGLGSGIVGVVKGASRLSDAEKTGNQDEIDKAQQEMITGTFVGVTSAIGLKSIGSLFRTNPLTAAQASSAPIRTSMMGKVASGTSNFFRDIFINSFKATKHSYLQDMALINTMGGGLKGWAKATGAKFSTAYKTMTNSEAAYNKQYGEMEISLENRIQELSDRIAVEASPANKAIMQQEQEMLQMQLNVLHSFNNGTQAANKELLSKNANAQIDERLGSYINNNGKIIIEDSAGNLHTISPDNPTYLAMKKNIAQAQDIYGRELKGLVSSREKMMRSFAKDVTSHQAELDNYIQKGLRDKFSNPDTYSSQVESLCKNITNTEQKIMDAKSKLASLQEKLASMGKKTKGVARIQSEIKRIEGEISTLTANKAGLDAEFAFASGIKFPKWYNFSKNPYKWAIGGSNAEMGFGKMFAMPMKPLTHPVSTPFKCYYGQDMYGGYQFVSPFEIPVQNANEQISQANEGIKSLKELRDTMNKAKTKEEINSAVSQYNQFVTAMSGQTEQTGKTPETQQTQEQATKS